MGPPAMGPEDLEGVEDVAAPTDRSGVCPPLDAVTAGTPALSEPESELNG